MRGHAYDSACETLRDMGYFGDADDHCETDEFKVLSSSQHTARKAHTCEVGCTIQPGMRYTKTVFIQEGRFEIVKRCLATGNCHICLEQQDKEREQGMAEYHRQLLEESKEYA